MNTKLAARGLGFSLLAASLVWAAEPWEEKEYTEWSKNDIREITQDSPWARQVRILTGGVDLQPSSPPSAQQTGPSTSDLGQGAGTEDPSQPSRPRGTVYVVQWASSMTVRQAQVRLVQMQGREVTEEQVQQYLSTTPPYYVLVIFGPDMQGFEGISEEAVKKSAKLELKETDREISAERVSYQRQGDRLVAVQVFFPRTQEGEPLIGLDEEKAKFSCNSSRARINTDFDLSKMTRNGELDI